MRTVWAMVCGTIRDQVDFSLIMDYLLRCREKGIIQGIVVSTWVHEFDGLGDLQMHLALNNVDVIQSPTNEGLVGNMQANSVNYWRQAKQMQAALDRIPPEAIVLKTRTDRALPATKKLIAMLAEPDPLPLVSDRAQATGITQLPRVFDHQIAIFKARTGRILQFTDFAFMGYSRDVRKLVNFDISDFTFTRGLVANIQFFIYPFIRDYPVIRDYYRVIDFYPLLADLKTYTTNGGTVFPKFFERVYAAYFGLLALHFRIGSLPDPTKLGPVTLPIEFADLFHSGQGKHLVHDALGVTLNSQEILTAFMSQTVTPTPVNRHWWQRKSAQPTPQPAVQDAATKHVLAAMAALSPATLDRITDAELTELKTFAANRKFSPHAWLRIQQGDLQPQSPTYAQSLRYQLPGISAADQDALWQQLAESTSANRVLYRYWRDHNIAPENAAAYLMSSARTDNRFSILTVTRLLRQGFLDGPTTAEVLRINDFFASFHVRHGRMNAEIAAYCLARYLYLVEHHQQIPATATAQVKFVFKRFLPGKFAAFQAIVTDSAALIEFFDQAIAERQGTKQTSARQRVIEMALEVTHDAKYWLQLEPLFNGRYRNYEYAYRYGISWQLI
ncbi:hypothetical protein [Levilactobacillus suantsaiihabitans]|uniref:Uncharacterized protein n=1 Tax=Levilactobacillus suantsaiihabitans TaxID=2487722 RepID=A0A4Z0J7I3_9LACO|nr:hypothetical protein [Levilactobacillus suantsaiihabitans]TGD18166.1 hypothetical protein EGT51_09650 [Levilactobacillus suantsaiihabitans]